MRWAANRETTQAEDKAYSLLGTFDINMPVLYGEGEKKAFGRLREEVYKDGKKCCRDEVSEAPVNPSKRLNTSRDQFSSVPYPTTNQSLIEQLYFTEIDERLISLTAA